MKTLDRNHYHRIIPLIDAVPFNHLFALAVLKGYVEGKVYTDELTNPQLVWVEHPYGMSLMAGYSERSEVWNWITAKMMNSDKQRQKTEWLQVYPEIWNDKFRRLSGIEIIPSEDAGVFNQGKTVALQTRVNFRFSRHKYTQMQLPPLPEGFAIEPVTDDCFNVFEGSVVPSGFWNNSQEFVRYGAGFCAKRGEEIVSTAFSAFLLDGYLELGIETHPAYRGQGLAAHCCAALINYSLMKGLEPVWACRLGNTQSYRLALRLGFEPVAMIPYYQLSF